MKPRILTTLLICSATLATTVTPAVAAVVPTDKATFQAPAVNNAATYSQADTKTAEPSDISSSAIFDLGVNGNKLVDSKSENKWTTYGRPTILSDTQMNGRVFNFDGMSAYYTTLNDNQMNQLKNGLTIEAYFKYDPSADTTAEHEIFSSQQSGGFGLGSKCGKVIFFAHDGHGYKKPQGVLETGKWIHAVGVIDKNKTASLYLNGKLVQRVKMPGNLTFAKDTRNLVLGGDAVPGSHVQSQMTGKVKSARLYNRTLNSDQIAKLSQDAQKDWHDGTHVEQTVGTKLVGPKQIAAGAIYGLNVHARQLKDGDRGSISMDVTYDPAQFDYVDADRTLGGNKTTVEKIEDGRLRVTSSQPLANAQFIQYAKTRLAHINLRAKKGASGKTTINFEKTNKQATFQLGSPLNVDIVANNPLDYNGDGIVGVGDVALAPSDKKAEVAAKAEIKPYKHVIVLTTDGGGNPWDPNGIFYTKGAGKPTWHTDSETMKKRQNTYTMDLFNKKFAMSTSAKSVIPAISAQNYISMLHGRPWDTLPDEYKGTNDTMAQQYFADFGKETPSFPSVFKVLQKNNPNQKAAAFSKWGQIVNAIIEPDAAVYNKQSSKLKSFDDVADYIGTDDFKNTSMVYMQSDYMDDQGHTNGWFNDNYWKEYKQYDGLFQKVMNKLETTGHIHDTLVIANSDHGGAGHSHGANDAPNRKIFIALGGETIDSGKRLNGGSNADISALVLNALQVQKPDSYLSNVFDQSAFLSQADLAKKKRDVEIVKLDGHGNKVNLSLANLKTRDIKTVDLRINLAGHSIANVQGAKGVKIIRQVTENGSLKLTVSSDKPVTGKLATITLKQGSQGKIALTQAMAATNEGSEILVDLSNEYVPSNPDNNLNPGSNSHNESNSNSGSVSTPEPSKPENTKPNHGNSSNGHTIVNVHKVITLHGFNLRKRITLYTSDLKKISHRALLSGTEWLCDKVMTKNGHKYYRVSSNEWVKAEDAYEFTNIAKTLTTPKGKITSLVNSKGEEVSNRGLASNSKWSTDRSVMINGKLHYRVSTNEFVPGDEMNVE